MAKMLGVDAPMPPDETAFAAAVVDWYEGNARDLPWRAPGVTPWAVLVSEVMLQQTPAARVIPAWRAWIERWPTPAALAEEPVGEAIRQWGRLGYPRRAMRLHQAARLIVEWFDGEVPSTVEDLRSLPGLGAYAAAAVAAFAFDARVAVLDTNVRRVYARWADGLPRAVGATPSVAETRDATRRVPETAPGRYSVAVMELGALVCTARSPRCEICPVAGSCAWLATGRPGIDDPPPPGQAYAGTDRQVRGLLLAVVRNGPASAAVLDAVWPDAGQRGRALRSLLADGLLTGDDEAGYRLPG